MRIWLSYSIMCKSLEAGPGVLQPEAGDSFFFGCQEEVVGQDPYGRRTISRTSPEILSKARDLYFSAKAESRAMCSGDLRTTSSREEQVWEALGRISGHPVSLIVLLGDYSGGYNYPKAVELLAELGIEGINLVRYPDV